MELIFWLLFFLLPQCQYEDSGYCAWHAETSGNHIGFDLVNIGDMTIYGPYHGSDGRTNYDVDYTVRYASED